VPADLRLVQLARMLAVPLDGLTPASATALISARAPDLAAALFREAADSDDVTSIDSAVDYLESRLVSFGDLISAPAATTIRAAFADRIQAWR